jgi:hypothetical protein
MRSLLKRKLSLTRVAKRIAVHIEIDSRACTLLSVSSHLEEIVNVRDHMSEKVEYGCDWIC